MICLRWFRECANRYRRSQGLRIYCYHGVVETKRDQRIERNLHELDEFRRQVAFLRRRDVLGVDDLAEILSTGRLPRRAAAVLTFDDGYVNNLLAAEVLDRYALPWCVFVTTEHVGRFETIWTVELSLLILMGAASQIELFGSTWPLRDRSEREASFQSIRYTLKMQPADARIAFMDVLRSQFPDGESTRLLQQFPGLRLMSWEELSQLNAGRVTIGSHGVRHEIHHGNQDGSIRLREMMESRTVLENRLGSPCRYFAFPNGDHDQDSTGQLEAAGYELGFTMVPGVLRPDLPSRLLPRFSPPGRQRAFVRDFYSAP